MLESVLRLRHWERYCGLFTAFEPMLRALTPTRESLADFDLFQELLSAPEAQEVVALYRRARPRRKAMDRRRRRLLRRVVCSRLSPGRRVLFRLGVPIPKRWGRSSRS